MPEPIQREREMGERVGGREREEEGRVGGVEVGTELEEGKRVRNDSKEGRRQRRRERGK